MQQMRLSVVWLDHVGPPVNLFLSVCVIYSITSRDNRRWLYVNWFQDRVYWRCAQLCRLGSARYRATYASLRLFPLRYNWSHPTANFHVTVSFLLSTLYNIYQSSTYIQRVVGLCTQDFFGPIFHWPCPGDCGNVGY